ncbi:hypothetical protein V1477_014890 [Vespula maculifrons]|uniref:Uncharacterized protein n=1 Tax=Vespula maculifrons TaxID=7453 RepID=A0ABD2BIS7_VESMC
MSVNLRLHLKRFITVQHARAAPAAAVDYASLICRWNMAGDLDCNTRLQQSTPCKWYEYSKVPEPNLDRWN